MTEVNFLCFSLSVLQLFLDNLVLWCTDLRSSSCTFPLAFCERPCGGREETYKNTMWLTDGLQLSRILRYSYQIPLVKLDVLKWLGLAVPRSNFHAPSHCHQNWCNADLYVDFERSSFWTSVIPPVLCFSLISSYWFSSNSQFCKRGLRIGDILSEQLALFISLKSFVWFSSLMKFCSRVGEQKMSRSPWARGHGNVGVSSLQSYHFLNVTYIHVL